MALSSILNVARKAARAVTEVGRAMHATLTATIDESSDPVIRVSRKEVLVLVNYDEYTKIRLRQLQQGRAPFQSGPDAIPDDPNKKFYLKARIEDVQGVHISSLDKLVEQEMLRIDREVNEEVRRDMQGLRHLCPHLQRTGQVAPR